MNYKALRAEVERLESENRWLHEHLDEMNAGAQKHLETFCERLAELPDEDDDACSEWHERYEVIREELDNLKKEIAVALGWTLPSEDRFWFREDHGPVHDGDLADFLVGEVRDLKGTVAER